MDCIVVNKPKVRAREIREVSGKQIGAMGGAFNPVHIAHSVAAEQVMAKLHLDETWSVPDNIPPHKELALNIPAEDRASMLELATKSNPRFKVMFLELYHGGISYTIDTVHYLKKEAPENSYYLIMGSSWVNSSHAWKDTDELTRLAASVGIRRPGYTREAHYPLIWVDTPDIRLLSTVIRHAIKTGTSIRYLAPDNVREYIEQRGLYRD